MLEERAYGYFHLMNASAPNPEWLPRIVLNYTTAGASLTDVLVVHM